MRNTIRINLRRNVDHSYDIRIGTSLREAATAVRSMFPGSKLFIVTDTNVRRRILPEFIRSFRDRSTVYEVAVPPGEKSKTRKMKETIEDRLLALGADRNS